MAKNDPIEENRNVVVGIVRAAFLAHLQTVGEHALVNGIACVSVVVPSEREYREMTARLHELRLLPSQQEPIR